MAQQVKIVMVSDLGGGPADETVQFGLDGTRYEIDLATDEAVALRDAFKQYIQAGRKAAASATGRSKDRSAGASAKRDTTRKIREWAKEKGYRVSERGRIPTEIIGAYQKATA
jgi:thiazole synthase ThiGH ThiG subunit